MKKIFCVLMVLVIFGCLVGCSGNKQFENDAALMEFLNGMYVLEDNHEDRTYYIFRDGKVYFFSDVSFQYKIEDVFATLVNDNKLKELCEINYETALDTLTTDTLLKSAEKNVVVKPRKGKIVINEGTSYEKQILVTQEGVSVKEQDDKNSTPLRKLCDEPDFSGEHFVNIFEETKKNYPVSTANFWINTKDYGETVKAFNTEVEGWELTTQNETTTVYESSKWIPSISGALIITEESVSFTRKVSVSNSWNPSFTILYTPAQNKLMIIDQDNLSLDLPMLISYMVIAVHRFPGAYASVDYMDLYNDLADETAKVENGAMTVEKTINGLTYKVQVGTDGYWAIATVTANETMKLSDIIQYSQETKEEKVEQNPTDNSGDTTQPSATQPSATQPSTTQPSTTQPSATQSPAACSHNYTAATCTEPQTCSRCGATTGSAAGHTWKNATCTEPATCTTCHETWGTAKGHSWKDATCSAPKTCQTCKATEGSALPHNMYYTICTRCDHTDFSEYTLTSNTFCLDSWFYLRDGYGSHYLEDGEASINIDSNGVCKVTFDKYSYTFTLKQTAFYGNEPVFECYMNGEYVKNAKVTFYYSQNRCDFFLYGGTLGFTQVALNFDM